MSRPKSLGNNQINRKTGEPQNIKRQNKEALDLERVKSFAYSRSKRGVLYFAVLLFCGFAVYFLFF